MHINKWLYQSWRWYGPEDTVSLKDIKQAGATHIVSALHHIPHGQIWPKDEILKRKEIIENAGLVWHVVESVPVHEDIKTGIGNWGEYIRNYKETLQNLADCGIFIVCYNFMPVLDWTRTQLNYKPENGAEALRFDRIDLAVFDIFILERENAAKDYPSEILLRAERKFYTLSPEDQKILQENILMGIPGERDISPDELKKSIQIYNEIGTNGLRENLTRFLKEISGVCIKNNIKMTLHPDDPPYSILGLPRIAGNLKDFQYIFDAVDKEFNGLCFCTGSLGAGNANMIPEIFEKFKDRVHFVHLRNVKKDVDGNFYEADHLDGDVDMYRIMKMLVEENQKREIPIPFRPDHGHRILDDLNKKTNPGYSAIGRLKGLAELRGLEMGILGN